MLPIAILMGGLATRLRPITETIPKALIEVARRPFIVWQLEALAKQGALHVVLCTGYLGEQIEALVGNGADYGLRIDYSPDGPALLGTGGAIKKALPLLGDTFFVLYGDSFLPVDFNAVETAFYASGQPSLMTVLRNGNRWDKSNARLYDGKVEYNKHAPHPMMEFIDYGLSVLTARVFERCASVANFDLADLYQQLSADGEMAGLEVTERFYEIGSHQGIAETEAYFMKKLRLQ